MHFSSRNENIWWRLRPNWHTNNRNWGLLQKKPEDHYLLPFCPTLWPSMSDIHHTTVQAFRGADIAHILYKIKHNKASIYSKYTIVLIGTNVVASLKSVDDDMSLFQTLITRIRSKSSTNLIISDWGARWLSGRVSDSGARGPGFETYLRRVVSLSKTLYSPKVMVNYPGSDGSVPTWLKNCWLGR